MIWIRYREDQAILNNIYDLYLAIVKAYCLFFKPFLPKILVWQTTFKKLSNVYQKYHFLLMKIHFVYNGINAIQALMSKQLPKKQHIGVSPVLSEDITLSYKFPTLGFLYSTWHKRWKITLSFYW